MSVYYRHLTVNFNSYVGIKQPNMKEKDKFYKVSLPEKFKLRPRDDIYLDLKFDIQTPETIEAWLNLLSCHSDYISKMKIGRQTKQKAIQFSCTYSTEVLIIQQA